MSAKGPPSVWFFVTRARGAQGIATAIVKAAGYDELERLYPDLEPLAIYPTLGQAQQHMVDDTVFTQVTDYGRKQ